MAEIGLVASVVQIADTGIKLSITLYSFAETVLTADKSIREIAGDVSLTSSVLEELGRNLKKDQKSRLCSENAVKTAEGIVTECAAIFNEIDGTLQTILEKIKPGVDPRSGNGKDGAHGGRKMAVAALERLKWPFLQPKMQLLRSNLDRLKSTLVLMLNVITYARKVSEDHALPSTLEDQRRLIEDLARSNQEYTRKFKELTKAVEAGPDSVEAVKTIPTMKIEPSSSFFQSNMVLPPTESFQIARETSPDIFSRLNTLAKQHLPPDAGEGSDELAHYCLLINHLLQRVDAVQYKIKSDLRRRIRNDVVHMHQREADQLRDVHGHRRFTTIMGSAILWAEILQPTESGPCRTLRDSIHPGWSEQDWGNFEALLKRGDGLQDAVSSIREEKLLTHVVGLAPPSFRSDAISGMDRQGELVGPEKSVELMKALERMMRPFAAGEENTPERPASASYGIRPRLAAGTDSLAAFDLDKPKMSDDVTDDKRVATSAMEDSRARTSHRILKAGTQHEAQQILPVKSDEVVDGASSTTRHSGGNLAFSGSYDSLTSRSYSGSGRHEMKLPLREATAVIEESRPEMQNPPTSNYLDLEREWIKNAMAVRQHHSLDMIISPEDEERGVRLAGDLQVLDALISIRDKILKVASPEYIALSRPTSSAREIAEDAILTGQKFWDSIQSIHEDAHANLSHTQRVRAVARLADTVLASAPVTAQGWKGLAKIDAEIDSFLAGGGTGDEARARSGVLHRASRKFALLTASQRRALREAWSSGVEGAKVAGPVKKPEKPWKQVQRLSQSIISFPSPKRRMALQLGPAAQSMDKPQPARSPAAYSSMTGGLSTPPECDYAVPLELPATPAKASMKSKLHPLPVSNNNSGNEASIRAFDDSVVRGVAERLERRDINYPEIDESLFLAPVKYAADYVGYGSIPLVTRSRTPDIVDDLLAEWTTLPR